MAFIVGAFSAKIGFLVVDLEVDQRAEHLEISDQRVHLGRRAGFAVEVAHHDFGVALGESGRAWTMLYFDPEVVHEALSDIRDRDSRDFEFVYPVDPRPLADRFRTLFQAITSQRAALRGEEALLLLLSQTLERPRAVCHQAASTAGLYRVRQMMDEAPQTPFGLAELSAEAGMSRFRFLRAFSSVTGLTPHSYLMQRRLLLARRALAKGVAPAEAAFASGFCDQSHLNRVFVRHFGTTPALYRHALS